MESGTELAGRYRLEAPLGAGDAGEAWRCRDLCLDREVAVRLLSAGVLSPDDEGRLAWEARCAAGLRHPGIAAVFGSGRHDGRMFVVTEVPRGQNLAALLRARPGGLPADQVLAIGADVAAALAYAHGEGIVHRDLRPLNILVRDDGPAQVRDFGIARYLRATSPAAGPERLLGAPEYRSPEQWAGEPATPGSDLYALGCTLYELLAGRPLFPGPSLPVLVHRHLADVPARPAGGPAALGDLVMALLAKAPEDRPPDAARVVAALARIRGPGAPGRHREAAAASRVPLACVSPAAGVVDVHVADSAGRIRGSTGTCAGIDPGSASGPGLRWHGWADLPPGTAGKVSALAAGHSGRGVYVTAVIDGIPCVNEGMTGWRALLGTCPLRLPVADIAVPAAARGAADAGGVTAYALDDDGLVWSSRTATPLNPAAAGPFSAIAACGWGRTDPGPVLLAATADAVQCRYWWAGTREFRWRRLPVDAAGRSVADVACVSLAARRMEAFVLYDDGSVWHSSLRLAQEAVLDWSTWARLPVPPGRVTAIAACQFDQRDGAVVAATSDGALHCATYGIEVAGTGLSRWSRWAEVPAAWPPRVS